MFDTYKVDTLFITQSALRFSVCFVYKGIYAFRQDTDRWNSMMQLSAICSFVDEAFDDQSSVYSQYPFSDIHIVVTKVITTFSNDSCCFSRHLSLCATNIHKSEQNRWLSKERSSMKECYYGSSKEFDNYCFDDEVNPPPP